VNGPKIMPRDKTAKLGKIIKGKMNFLGKKIAAKNKHILTVVPTSHCGWPNEKGTEKDRKDKLIKTKIGTDAGKLTGRLSDKVFWNIFEI